MTSANDLWDGYTYTYGDGQWKDLLTGLTVTHNGKSTSGAFTYDQIGNPLTYFNGSNWTFTWRNGRQLATAKSGTKTTKYEYNADGLRTRKTNADGTYADYYWVGSTLLAEVQYKANGAADVLGKGVVGMKKDCKEIVWTKCNYGGAILIVVLTLLLILGLSFLPSSAFENLFTPVVGIAIGIWTLRQYAFSERGVTIEICRIPIRRIKWKDIKQVGVITYKIYHLQIVTRDAERY